MNNVEGHECCDFVHVMKVMGDRRKISGIFCTMETILGNMMARSRALARGAHCYRPIRRTSEHCGTQLPGICKVQAYG